MDTNDFAQILPELVNRYRVHDLSVTYCNAAWAAEYGVQPADAIGHPLDRFLSDDDIAGLHAQLAVLGPDDPVIADPVPRESPSTGRWIAWVDRYVAGPDGPEVLSVGRDVTERYVAERELAASEARFRALADRSSDIVWHVLSEPVPQFAYVSPSVEQILGYPALAIIFFLIAEPHGLARLWQIAKEKLRLWPFPH